MKSYGVTVAPSQTPYFTLYLPCYVVTLPKFLHHRTVGHLDLLIALHPTLAIQLLLDTPLLAALVSVVVAACIFQFQLRLEVESVIVRTCIELFGTADVRLRSSKHACLAMLS